MINHYEIADVIELGRGEELILGNKELYPITDSNTQLYGSRVIDSMDEIE